MPPKATFASILSAEANAFESVFHQHYRRIYSVLYRLLGNEADAEDATQLVFLKFHQAKPCQLPDDDTRLVGWLYRVAVNEGYSALRRRLRRQKWHDRFDRLWPFSRTAPDPASLFDQQDNRAQVRRILTELKPREAKLLMLRHAGLSYQELAEAVGVAPGSVGSLLTQARRKFETHYTQTFPDEE